jgi:hypothetical protein
MECIIGVPAGGAGMYTPHVIASRLVIRRNRMLRRRFRVVCDNRLPATSSVYVTSVLRFPVPGTLKFLGRGSFLIRYGRVAQRDLPADCHATGGQFAEMRPYGLFEG